MFIHRPALAPGDLEPKPLTCWSIPRFANAIKLVFPLPDRPAPLEIRCRAACELDRYHRMLEEGSPNPSLHRMVVIGHRMGGLIASLMLRGRGDRPWTQFSDAPCSRLRLSARQKKEMQDLFFSTQEDVARVIFVSTPICAYLHPGSHRWITCKRNVVCRDNPTSVRVGGDDVGITASRRFSVRRLRESVQTFRLCQGGSSFFLIAAQLRLHRWYLGRWILAQWLTGWRQEAACASGTHNVGEALLPCLAESLRVRRSSQR